MKKPFTTAQLLKMRPLKKTSEEVKLVPGPAPTRAEKERRRKEAMD